MPNFKDMLKPVRFGKPPEEVEAEGDAVPTPLLRPADQARRFAQLREAKAVLDVLPGPGECLHAIMTGRYDLCDLIGVMIERLGAVQHLRIATLAYAARNVTSLRSWIEAGRIVRLSLLCSEFFKGHNAAEFELLRLYTVDHPPHRLAASRSHCKVICFDFGEWKLVLEGSANLRTNSNWEQFVLIRDIQLHDYHASWIDAQIDLHAAVGKP